MVFKKWTSLVGIAAVGALLWCSTAPLWVHDRSTGATRLVARGFHFLDGILVEPDPGGSKEVSVLVTETTRFRIQRLMVDGPEAGRHAVLWDDLPGMPDGMDRDAAGNVWVGLLTLRSGVTDWIHAHPWIKPLLLRLPPAWMPKGSATGVLAFDPLAENALFLVLHDGPLIRDVSVAIPSLDRIYLASFDPSQRGLSWIPKPIP